MKDLQMNDIDQKVIDVFESHRKFCSERENETHRHAVCGGQTVDNMPNKCSGCPYDSELSCIVKFAIMQENK